MSQEKSLWLYYGDLILLGVISLGVGFMIYLAPIQPLLAISGAGLIFFIPGYSLLTALYPSTQLMSWYKRFFASFAVSVIVSGLLSIAIAYSIGLTLHSSYVMLLLWTFLMLAFAWRRRSAIPPGERTAWHGSVRLSRFLLSGDPISETHPEMSQSDRRKWTRLSAFLNVAQVVSIVLILLAAGRLWWVSSQSQPQFTEFYILGRDGLLGDYPEQVLPGGKVTLTLGVVNQEKRDTTYQLFYQLDEMDPILLEQFSLPDGGKWEQEITLDIPQETQVGQLSFLLYKDMETAPIHQLHVWLGSDREGQ